MGNERIYENLIEWFRRSGAYVPESKELIPLIEATYTLEEAEILTGMPLILTKIFELAETKGMDPSKLTAKLDEMAGKGLVFRSHAQGEIRYRPNPPRFVFLRSLFWPGRDDDYTRSVAPHVTRYYLSGFGDYWKEVKTKGLRAIPIEKAIADHRGILPYEAVVHLLKGEDRIAVANCACRHRSNSDPNLPNCKHETENCLHFGKLAVYIIENGLGREIELEECREILSRAADAGLVHAASNWQEKVDTLCNCCPCCCVYFQAFHVLRHGGSMAPSNYEASVDPDTCSGCGLCVKRCPMGALQLTQSEQAKNKMGKVCTIEPAFCIGCGVCAYKCPTHSLTLGRRQPMADTPLNVAELKKRYIAERAAGEGEDVSKVSYKADISSGEGIG